MRFSIVTATNNSERYLADTIESVISQSGDFEIQYVIVDNLSCDRTLEIARHYQRLLGDEKFRARCRKVSLEVVCEADKGMYDAINKGFARTSGEIMAWINSDDIYLPNALDTVARAFREIPEVTWLKGITCYMNERSEIVKRGECFLYNRRWVEEGYCGPLFPFIQQDSVFWKRALWDKVGGCDGSLRLAGDYFLWCSFAHFEPLYSFPRYLSCFRHTAAQLSGQIEEYWNEARTRRDVPGLARESLIKRCLNTRVLPRWLKIAMRRRLLGPEDFHALAEGAEGWMRWREGEAVNGSLAMEDRATSVVLGNG